MPAPTAVNDSARHPQSRIQLASAHPMVTSTWRNDKVTTVSLPMMRSALCAASPLGQCTSRVEARTVADTNHTSTRRWRKTAPMASAPSSTATVTPTRSRPAPSAPAMATPTPATRARLTDAATNTAASVQPARASSAPLARYWRKVKTADTTGPAGIELAMAVAAAVMPVTRRTDTSTPPAASRHRWMRPKATREPASAVAASTTHHHRMWIDVARGARQLAAPPGQGPQRQGGQAQPHHVLQPGPGPPPGGALGVVGHDGAGSTRIFTCSSGWARASKAPGTPSMSTVEVIMADTSTSPSAMARSAWANSSGR